MDATARRQIALERAQAFSPFLRETARAFPDIAETFAAKGAAPAIAASLAIEADDLGAELRRRRTALALAVALGDLAGELDLEGVTAALSDFADDAIDRALAAAIAERVPGAGTEGFAVLALGKLGSRELNYSSDVDLILLFDPAALPRRERDEPGEAAVRVGRRLVELLQQRTEHGYVARVDMRLRPSPEVTPIALPVDAAISYYESQALPWERAAFIRARAAAGDRALGERFLERNPAVHLAPGARLRRHRRDPRHQRAHPRPLCARPGASARASTSSAAAAASARPSSSPRCSS